MTNWACDEVTCFPTNSLSQETYDSSRSENFQKHCISQFVLSTGRRAVNAEEHYSMAVMGNTHFAKFKSSENKISGGNCNIFCQTITIQYSKTTARTRHSRKRLQTKTRQGQAVQSPSLPSGRSNVSHRKTRSTFACITWSQMSVVLFLTD